MFPIKSLFFCLLCLALHLFAWSDQSPSELREAAREGFVQRWAAFQGDTKTFPLWTRDWKDDELRERYDRLCQDREKLYYKLAKAIKEERHPRRTEEYRKSKQKIKGGYSMPSPFAYNQAYPGYNASIVTLDGKQFLAMEAPTKHDEKDFFEILTQYGVTDLVRLVPFCEEDKEKTTPYWEGHVNIDSKTGRPTVMINGREINYIATDCWPDQQAIEPERLIALVKAAMANKNPQQIIAVHCHAGIGRTGTFLVAYELIREIDEQIARGVSVDCVQVSVDKVLWEVSLQRISAVGTFSQYRTLYQLVGVYLNSLKPNQK